MSRMFKNTVLLLLACAAPSLLAAPVDANHAQGIASRFLTSSTTLRMLKASSTPILAHTEPWSGDARQADYYVFNTSDGSAFVIIPGDDRAEEVLAYGDGSLDMNNLPCNLQWMLGCYKEQLEWLHSNPSARVERAIPVNDVTIAPIVHSNWSQSEPFYNQCPDYNGERSVTGCVATAMAQVMYYWHYPEHAPALSGYTTRSHRIHLSSLPEKRLDWDNMLNDYASTPYNNAQADAVATLMRYCGQSVQMDYSPDGSGAYVYRQLAGMKEFGYNNQATALQKSDYTYDEWDALLQHQLLSGWPVLYSGNDPAAGGHAFVVDGYYDGKYHVNWGWGGNYDGYFALGAFNVRSYSFLSNQEFLCDIYPKTDVPIEVRHDFEVGGIYYRYGGNDGEATVVSRDSRYNSYRDHVAIPETVTMDGKTMTVTAIGDNAFRNCQDLTSVVLPQSVTSIGDLAFRNCANLAEVEIPSGVTSIGELAFASCLKLSSISIPASVKQVGVRAFVDCLGLTAVQTPDIASWLGISFADRFSNPLSMAGHLLVGGEKLEHMTIPEGIDAVGSNAFTDCIDLKTVTLNDDVKSIGTAAFARCTNLSTVNFPAKMTSLANQAFLDCSSLKAALLPTGITQLSSELFSGCTSLTTVTLPTTVTTIAYKAFSKCSSLASVNLQEGITMIGENAFEVCKGLHSIQLPESITTIGPSAFLSCSGLESITIPDQVKTIEKQTFAHCGNLQELTLGKSLEAINDKAFVDSRKLATVTCRGNIPADVANPDCFSRAIYASALLFVPAEARPIYKKSGIWPWFKNMIGINIGLPYGDINGDGEVNIADVNTEIVAIMHDTYGIIHDTNGDGEVNIADVNTIINLILKR